MHVTYPVSEGKGGLVVRYILFCVIGLFITSSAVGATNSDNGTLLHDLLEQIEAMQTAQDSLRAEMQENAEKTREMEAELKVYREKTAAPEQTGAGEEASSAPPPEKKERLERRIKKLEDMAGKTFRLDPVEDIKKVSEWVCPDGHIYDHSTPTFRCPIDGKPQKERVAYRKFKYARKESVSDLIEGMMEEEFKKRVAVGLSTTGVVQQTVNSDRKDATSAQGSFDLYFLHRPMLNSILFVDLESIGGSGPDIFSNTVSGLNDDVSRGSHQDDDGLDRVSVREVWLQSMLMEDRLRLVAGKIDLTNYFDMNAVANDETTQFLASAFVNNLALAEPPNGPGVVGYFDTKKGYSFGAGLQSSDNSGTAVTDRIFAIGELDYHTPKFLFGREGDYRFWGRYNGDTRSSAVGISFDQEFTQGLAGFSRFGITHNAAPGEVEWTWSAGLGLSAPFSLRRNDHGGLAFLQLKTRESKREELAEVYYNFFITDHMSVSLNSQVLLNSIREESFNEDYLSTFGLRLQMDF